MSEVSGLLLDLDGTLAHSLPVMFQSYSDFLGRFDRRGSPREFEELNGPTLHAIIGILIERHGLGGPPESLFEAYLAILRDNYRRFVKPGVGAEALLQYVESRALRVGLVTSSLREIAETFLAANRLTSHFSAIVTAEDVERGKPDPMIYHRALEVLGLSPDEALAVEDSHAGALSSTAAGVRTIFLKSSASMPPDSPLVIACACDLFDVRDRVQSEVERGTS